MYMLCTLMPATRAACGFSPTARNLKPRLERLRIHHTTIVAMMTRMKPKCRLYCGPNSSGKTAVSFIGGVFGLLEPGACSRPGVRSIHDTR